MNEASVPASTMAVDLPALVADLQRLAPRLAAYDPTDEDWRKAWAAVSAARNELAALLRTSEGVQALRASASLTAMKQLIPEVARGEIAALRVSDFVLALGFVEPFSAFEQVYRGFSTEYAKELSLEARKAANMIKSSYIYGEICFFPFADVLQWIAPQLPNEAILYDLGAGIGKAVIAAALLHPFGKVVGIESLEPLVACANKRRTSFGKLAQKKRLCDDIEFVHGDILALSWCDGDVVFCHGTCFTESEWSAISIAAEKMKQGSFFVSTSQVLHTALFEVVRSQQLRMSWGTATVYIHQRRRIGRWAAQMLRGGRASRTDLQTRQSEEHVQSRKLDEMREP